MQRNHGIGIKEETKNKINSFKYYEFRICLGKLLQHFRQSYQSMLLHS